MKIKDGKGWAIQLKISALSIALTLLKNELTAKQGIKGKRLKAGCSNDYLE